MRPMLWLALLASGGGAVAVSVLPDEEGQALLLPPAARHAPAEGAPVPAASGAGPLGHEDGPQPARGAAWPPLQAPALAAWSPPAPAAAARPAAAPPAPAASSAPPFPYTWLGQLEDQGRPQIFIATPHRVLAVRPGEVIEGRWRIDGVADGRLRTTWLPGEPTQAVAGH